MLNPHGLDGEPSYFKPLFGITKVHALVALSIAPAAVITPQLSKGAAEITEATSVWLKFKIRQGSRLFKEPTQLKAGLDTRM